MTEIAIVAGIDIGGNATKIGLVKENGESSNQKTFATNDFPDVKLFIKKCLEIIFELQQESNEKLLLKAIGIGAPNANDYRGTIENPVNLVWQGITPIVKMIKGQIDIPVVLTNDANAAAIGEKRFGGAKRMKNFIVITLGTGLGSGIYVQGKLLLGHTGLAGEMGHMIVEENGRMCNSGKRGCLEAYVSVTGIKRTIFSLLSKSTQESLFRKIPFNELKGEEITMAAINGDPIAIEAFEFTGNILGKKLAEVIALFDPEAIFIAGGLANSGDILLRPTKKFMEDNLFPAFKNKVKLMLSELLDRNGAIMGAGSLAWELLENKKNSSFISPNNRDYD